MFPELGTFAILIALCFSLLQGFSWLGGSFKLTRLAVIGQFGFLAFAMLCLILCFLMNDLTVLYVREHSHKLLPLLYKIGASWGGHEGSVLLWCLILAGWSLCFTLVQKTYNDVIAVLGLMSAGFITFLIFTSNPFSRNFPKETIVGNDLTPILQDPGLIFHPPMLYLGYVGFAIGFAFAICALLRKSFDKAAAQACRPWIILPWSFLSAGIVLGSWWAYRELGWGGWWFWDPVENASLLPWLSATALIHSLIVSEKKQAFKGWTLLLAIITFALSLLGTFLVRSGVLVSVHAFASDPTRGLFLLLYLAFIIGSAFTLYALRIKDFYRAPNFKLLSRETFLLVNSVFLITCVATIILGTLYPILLDALDLEKISIGEPYFNTVFVPIMIPLLFLMAIAPHVHWERESILKLWHKLRINLILTFCASLIIPLLFGFAFHLGATIGIFLGLWIIFSTLQYVYSLKKISLSHYSMIIAHVGIAVIAIAISINKSYSTERQVKMAVGETVNLAGYHFTFIKLHEEMGPNYKSITARFLVDSQELHAQQRIYSSHEQILSKPGIVFNAWRDLYLALGSPLDANTWSVRLYYKPCVRWIWAGGFLLVLSGFISLINFVRRKP